MGKIHPKKRLLQKFSEESCSKANISMPILRAGRRLERSDPSLQLSDVSSTSKNYETYIVDVDYEKSREARSSEGWPLVETNYSIPHLPDLIVTADSAGFHENTPLKPVTHDNLQLSSRFESRTQQVSFSTPEIGRNFKVIDCNSVAQNLSGSLHSQIEIQYPPQPTKPKNTELEPRSTRRY